MKRLFKKIIKFIKDLFKDHDDISPGDDQPKLALDFCYGAFAGGNAIEDKEVQIKDFKMNAKNMTYKWALNDMAKWGYPHTDAKALACAFYYDEASKTWKGGKFDWISSSRLSRGWENIYSKYKGWDPNKFFAAKKHGFCIVSGDAKKRTNLITD